MAGLLATLGSDVRAPIDRDPAVRGWLDVVLSYPGFHAVAAHRFIHPLYRMGVPILPRLLSNVMRFFTGIEIHPGAKIGMGVFIDHGMGVVIGETAEVGDGCTLYQGVTLGGTSLAKGKRHPTLGRDVVVGANGVVIGAITLGDGVKVGSGSVVVKDVPANATVVGVPARVVAQDGKPVLVLPDLQKSAAGGVGPDAIARMQRQIERLELRLNDIEPERTPEETWSWVI
jgi:serine O-acetyltransferase